MLYKDRQHVTDKAIRKLVDRVNLKELLLIAEADLMGRNVDRDFDVIRKWFMDKVFSLGLDPDKRIEPLVQGRDLLKLGLQPGPAYTRTLADAFELQLLLFSHGIINIILMYTKIYRAKAFLFTL